MNNYNIRLVVECSSLVTVEANSLDEAIAIAKEDFHNGYTMKEIQNSEYYEGLSNIEYESLVKRKEGDEN